MLCDVCQQPATEQCPLCQTPLCSDHGGPVCFRCAAAAHGEQPRNRRPPSDIYTSDRYSRRVWAKSYLQCERRTPMETIHVDHPPPPECHDCGVLTRQFCRHCKEPFCPDHACSQDLCASCGRSSLMGMGILATIGALWTALLILAR